MFNEVRQFAYVLWARETDFIDSTTNIICTLYTIQEGSAPLFIAKKTQEFRKPQLDSSSIQKQSPHPERRDRSAPKYACRSTDRWPCPTESSSCQSVDRAVDRSPTTVDRAVDLCMFMRTGRLGLLLAWYKLRSRFFWLPISALCFLMSLKKLHHNILSLLSVHHIGLHSLMGFNLSFDTICWGLYGPL